MQSYLVIQSRDEAVSVIQKINETKKFAGSWAEPIAHPVNAECLVPYDIEQLKGCEAFLSSYEAVSKHEALRRGWYLGPFTGRLAREKEKMEDIHCLFEAMVAAYGKPNFPAFRSLLLSFLSACYSLKDSFEKKSRRFPPASNFVLWWTERSKEISRREGELLQCYEQYMNNEKHGGPLGGQIPPISIHSRALMTSLYVMSQPINSSLDTLELTEQGAFVTVDIGTHMERRLPVGIHEARYDIEVENPPTQHLGQPIAGVPFMFQMSLIRDYYAKLLFSARTIVGEVPQDTPAMLFTDGTSMSVTPIQSEV